jgi:hypothetical protein
LGKVGKPAFARRFGVPESFSRTYRGLLSTQPDKRVLQANGRTVAHIWFDTDRTRMMRREERQHLAYHIGRLLSGEATAAMEWKHFGIDLEIEAASDQGEEATPQ